LLLLIFFSVVLWLNTGHGLRILKVLRSYTMIHHSWQNSSVMSDQLITETSPWQHTILTTDKHPCPWQDSHPQSQQARGCRPAL